VALGNLDNDWLPTALIRKIFREFLSQQTRMRAHDAVFARVVAGNPMKDMDSNLLLSRRFGRLINGAIRNVTQKLPQSQRRLELITRKNTFDQSASLVGF
jgi:hypothetical protein